MTLFPKCCSYNNLCLQLATSADGVWFRECDARSLWIMCV